MPPFQMTQQNLAQAIETVDAVKTAIKREEETIRQKTAEALALKAQWKNSQIQNAMHKALDNIGGGIAGMEQTFGRAQENPHRQLRSAGPRRDGENPRRKPYL